MRIFRGLENIHSVIDRHETEWRRENGEPELRTPDKIAESVRQRLAVQPDSGSGRFDESRFLGGKTKPAKKTESESSSKPEFTPSKPDEESVKFSADRFLGGNSEPVIPEESHEAESEIMPDAESNEPEAVEVIPNKEGRHSWLYNEVMKAINDASKGTSAKIIAVFIPVVQNGKEFEDLPADETVTISPVDESLAKIESPANVTASETVTAPVNEASEDESPSEDFNLIPEIQPEQKAEIAETFREMEEMLDEKSEPEIITEESETITEEVTPEIAEESEIVTEEESPAIIAEETQPEIITEESETITEEVTPEITEESESVTEEEESPAIITEESETVTEEITPETTEETEIVTEEESPAVIAEESEPEIFTDELMPAISQLESETDDDTDDVLQDGEPMEFEEIENVGGEELTLTDELDDDNIFDESLTEVQKPDDDKALILDEDGIFLPDDEIEIIPDPKK